MPLRFLNFQFENVNQNKIHQVIGEKDKNKIASCDEWVAELFIPHTKTFCGT